MHDIFSLHAAIALLNLTLLELVLGIDNILFISILSDRLPHALQNRARKLGLLGALVSRILLLLSIKWLVGLTEPLFQLFEHSFSWRDLILLFGGLFLLFKATVEIYNFVELDQRSAEDHKNKIHVQSLGGFLLQVALVDLIFSIDSVITAIGLVEQIPVMVTAILLSIILMMLFSEALNRFIKQHPALKILALSFLVVVGIVLIADGLGQHIHKGFIYFGMGFTLFVEILNIRRKSRLEN